MPLSAFFKLDSNAGFSKPPTGKCRPLHYVISLLIFLKGCTPQFLLSFPAGPSSTFLLLYSRVMCGVLSEPDHMVNIAG